MSVIQHPSIKDGWFHEISEWWPGQAASLQVKKVLCHERSPFQDVLIFESTQYGIVLALDNVIQCTERDEFAYQEMISHLPLNSHSCPKKVLIIGGGDGGVLREVLQHDCIEEVVLCDIDEAVIRLSQQYMPSMSASFKHPKVKVFIEDGMDFLARYHKVFDVIITDSSDPEGPAQNLFQKTYFELLFQALRDGGIISMQAGSIWLDLPLITKLKTQLETVFPVVEYAITTVPTYTSGQIGFLVCCVDRQGRVNECARAFTSGRGKHYRYYSPDLHKASFVLPAFASAALTRK